MIRIILCVLMVAAGTAGGFIMAGRLSMRRQILDSLIYSLEIMRNEIYYTHERLEKIAGRTAAVSEGASAQFFRNFAGRLAENADTGASDVWHSAVEGTFPQGCVLKERDIEALDSAGTRLGKTDVSDQCSNLERTIRELSLRYSEAEKDEAEKSRLYKTLGTSAGILAAVMII